MPAYHAWARNGTFRGKTHQAQKAAISVSPRQRVHACLGDPLMAENGNRQVLAAMQPNL